MGSDFPADLRDLIETWNTKCVFRLDTDRLTTAAWNGYGHNEHRGKRDFCYWASFLGGRIAKAVGPSVQVSHAETAAG